MTESFKDHFSGHSDLYARYRPGYPEELFDYVASLAPRRGLVWDVATGSGQAAAGLAERFERVVATDASAEQIAHAAPHPGVEYKVAKAEELPVEPGTADLVTVAQALHWFDFAPFFDAVDRALVHGGVFAAWTYRLHRVSDAVDALTDRFYNDVVGPYWPPERRHVETEYRDIPIPFEPIDTRPLRLRLTWTIPTILGYLRSWSATQGYVRARGVDPVLEFERDLMRVWGNPDAARIVEWPITLRAGRKR